MSSEPSSAPSPPTQLHRSHGLLEGRSVLVTAAAGTGIGFATARRCALEGARVMLSDTHERRLIQSAEALEAETGREVPWAACDVRDDGAVRATIAEAESCLAGLDVLVNNAGLGLTKPIVETTDDEWTSRVDVNLGGAFRTIRAALPGMAARGAGSIVNVASICAWRAEAGQSAYGASKAGLLALTRCVALEAADAGVRVNAVVPSLAIHAHLEKVSKPDFLAQMVRENEAFGRSAAPSEIGDAIVFLASDYSSYVTGEALSVSCRHP